MADKKSSKNNLGNIFQAAKLALKNKFNPNDSHSTESSNTNDTDSMQSMCSLSSVSQKPNFEGITLIWYDPRIDKTEDTKLTAQELREINDFVIQYSDQVDCVKYMQSVENEKIFLITSGKAAISIMPEIEQLKQVDSIFIFCLKVEKYQYLLQKYNSIIGIYCERSTLIDSIKQNVELLQKQLSAFSFYNEHEEKATRDISKESAEFLWFQLFKDILLQMSRNDRAKQELIDFCRQYYRGNQKEYKNIMEFEQSYRLDKSIYWYTKDSFLYKLVNKALRTEDVGQLQIFRFFISDLSSKLAEIHKKQSHKQKNTVMLYRGLKLETDELKRLKQNSDCIVSANGFLSTSRSKDVAINFAIKSTKRTDIVPVLYEIECDMNTSESIIFADITKYSEFAQEQEVLFDLGSTFKLKSISEDVQLKLIVIKLIATDAGIKTVEKYIKLNRKMNEETTPEILFGILLIQMGKYDQSLKYFKTLLNGSNQNVDAARIYNEIGSAYLCKGELDKAFENADRAYQMMIRAKPSRIKDSSRPMTILGHIYLRKEMYEKSLDFYFEVLEIREKFYGRKHLYTATALNHIGNVYYKMEDYSKSLLYYEKSLKIREKQLPAVHLDIAASLNNLGLIAWKSDDVTDALDYYRRSLEIRKQLLPSDHNDIIQSLDNITRLLYEDGRVNEALENFAEVLTGQKIKFDSSDRDNLLSRLEGKFGPRKPIKLQQRLWPEYACRQSADYIRSTERNEVHVYCRHICSTNDEKEEALSIFRDFIETLDKDGDYGMALEAVKELLMPCDENTMCECYYTERVVELLSHVYDDCDENIKAFCFCEELRFLLENRFSHSRYIEKIQVICSQRINRKKTNDYFILENFIKIVDSDCDYGTALEAVKKILVTSPGIFLSGYNYKEYLMGCLHNMVENAYDSADESNKAFGFYQKVQSILKNTISHWADTSDIEIICLERIGYFHQLNDNYELALEYLEQSLKIRRDKKKNSDDIPDKLRCIGLIHMTLGNYKSALISFNDALKLLQANAVENDREIKLLLKRIDQAKEGLKSTTGLLE